ncbi:MAG: metallophosphoesterase [Oscillospiraceae bacterium]
MAKTKKRHLILRLLLLVALLLADSRWRLVTTEYAVASPRLPAAFDGFRVVQFSDLHGREFGEGNARLLKKVAAAEPDLIALTGDLADENTDLAVIDTLLDALTDIAPVYYVSGNHEWWAGNLGELEELFEAHGVRYLRNEYVLLEREGESIVLAGVEDPNGYSDMMRPDELVDIINKSRPDAFTVLLGHRNYWVEEYPDLEVDIILCGHAHGGIVRLPFLGGLLGTDRSFFPAYVDGMTASGRYQMIVSRGLGGSVPIPRFLNNPEIVVLTLQASE